MAITEKQAIMVIHQEGMTPSALAPQASSAHSLFVVLKPVHPGGESQDKGVLLSNTDSCSLGTSTVGFQNIPSMSLSAMAGTNSSNQQWSFPAENTCKGITVTLDNNNMWNEFYKCQTEMILTKQGRRMFPYCRFRISGLEPFQRYILVMDMHPADNHRYKWSDRRWETNGKGDPHMLRSFVHPESPATGLDWMQNPVSFYKLKLTNNTLDQDGHIIIHSMHRYLPRLHIVPADKATDGVQLNGPDVITFSFPQTEFFAVTAYQNLCITQLKIDYNPFAKGFRDDATNSRSCKPKNGLSTETTESESKPSRETTTINNLKTLFAKRNAAGKVLKGQPLSGSTDENSKAVNGDTPKIAEVEKSSSVKKRPWTEGLSELIKGAHVKGKKIPLEKVQDASYQQMNKSSLRAGEEEMDAASKDSEMENISVTAVITEETEVKKKSLEESGTVHVKPVTEAEGPSVTSTVSVCDKATELSTIKSTPESSAEATNMQTDSAHKIVSDKSVNEKADTALSETDMVTDGTSQSVIKPLDCGEVKKKRAEPVPLPLLALFLQQLKSKTGSTKPKLKSEPSNSPSHLDKSCKTTSVAENTPFTAGFSSSLTQSDAQAASSLTETITSPILTCTVTNTLSPCLSLFPTLVTSPTSPDMPMPLKPTLSLVVTDPSQDPDPTLAENKTVLTLDSDPGVVTISSANDVSNKLIDFRQDNIPAPLSTFADNAASNSPVLCTTFDNDVSDVFSDASCAFSPSSPPEVFPATMPDAPKNEVICSTVIATESTADPSVDPCTVPCRDIVLAAPCQPPLSGAEEDDEILFSQSSPDFSPPSPAPSSPDPFPPDLFTDRPIPPRKSLDPFPPDLLLNRPIIPVNPPNTLPTSVLFMTSACSQGKSGPKCLKEKGSAPPEDQGTETLGDLGPPCLGDLGPPCLGDLGPQCLGDLGPPYLGDLGPPCLGDLGPPCLGDLGPPGLGDLGPPGLGDSGPPYLGDSGPPCPGDLEPPCPTDTRSNITYTMNEMTCSTLAVDFGIPKEIKQPLQDSASKKSKLKNRKSGKSKLSDEGEVTEGPIPVPMQPNLEDVEGQLFVSFMSKKALEIHLGDEAKDGDLRHPAESVDGEVCENVEEKIEALEKLLLRDLKLMKHRQVIHPVLQEVGLKLNLLDLTLAIDLQYLGVCLPIPPPAIVPGGSSASSQVQFISRTGKTTDFTKIKGWRDKFATSGSTSLPAGTSSDAVQKNLSAFCSDMLDEYLESEGKLIDERAASFSQAVLTPVTYQLPTKSTSYVRTLDSVLKKQTPSFNIAFKLKPYSGSRKSTPPPKRKLIVKLGDNTSTKSFKSGAAKTASSAEKPSTTSSKDVRKVEENSKSSKKAGTSNPVHTEPSDPIDLSPSKKSKTKKELKTSRVSLLTDRKPAMNTFVGQDSTSSTPGGRISGLSKTLVKLLDVEDGAVWEGKHRTCITEERAAIALSSLVTAEGKVKICPSTIIRRRAPPCLNDFCRLGCVCSSLAQEKHQHHCGKPQCMLGCNCLRRKVVLLKNHIEDEDSKEEPAPHCQLVENGAGVTKKKKRKKAYILSGPEGAPEPVTHVKRLWDQKNDTDSECLFIPLPARPYYPSLLSPVLQQDLDNFLHPSPKKVMKGEELHMVRDENLMDCARARPFCRKNLSNDEQHGTKDNPPLGQEDLQEEMEEGELRPPVMSGPTKRLEIVSMCKWSTAGSRNVVLRVVCDHMAQDRLKYPFWVGKYRIQPISRTVEERDEGSTITYKVSISQPNCVKAKQKDAENEKIKQVEAQLIKTIGHSEVKGLPLLSHVTPAGLLKAEKKPTDAPGLITVNGKPYPQARLELGQMGALHPANRLAAYITGRVCVANENTAKSLTTTTISKTTPTAPTTSVTMKTADTSTHSSADLSVKPIVTTAPVGTAFTQVVINHLNSLPQTLPSTSGPQLLSSIKNLIKPPSSLTTGVTGSSISSNPPSNPSVASHAPVASGPTAGSEQIVKAVSASPTKKTWVISSSGPRATAPGGAVRLMQTVTTPQPPAPGQRMVFQMLKTSNGSTMYRSPNGQLVHLVPLSQFKALNPNFLISKQATIVRFPQPTTSTPQKGSSSSSTATSFTPATSTTPVHVQNLTPVHNTTTISTAPIITSSVAQTMVVSLSPTKPTLGQPSTVNTVPQSVGLVGNDSRITVTALAASNQNASNVPQSFSTTQSQDNLKINKSDGSVRVSSLPAVGSEQDVQGRFCLKQSESVVLEDHCYTVEVKTTSTLPEKHGDDPTPANASASNMLLKDVLEFGPVEDVDDDDDAEPEVGGESKIGLDLEIDSDSELTDDSDMYNHPDSTESSDQEDLCIDTDSDWDVKNEQKRDLVDVEMQDLHEKEDDELVDIETFEERDENKKQPERSHQNERAEDKNEFLSKKKKLEMERRSTLKDCFNRMRITLNQEERVSRTRILTLAQQEICALTEQRDQLVELQKKLKKKRTYFLQIASQISGKSEKSISQKLDEIIAKQKAMKGQNEAKNISSCHTHSAPKARKSIKKQVPKGKAQDILHRNAQMSSNSKPIDLSTTKQKNLRPQDAGDANCKQKVPEAHEKENRSVWRLANSPLLTQVSFVSTSPPTTLHLPPTSPSRERTRPNILSRSKSQAPVSPAKEPVFVPKVIPVVEAVVPCKQIFTISNPHKPIGISSLGERQSVTPGVAAVSISFPAISRPVQEKSVPVIQPQVFTLANSPVTSSVKAINLPKISSVVSLVPPDVLQKTVIPPSDHSQPACNPECVEAQQNPNLTSSKDVPPVREGQSLDQQLLEVASKQPEQGDKAKTKEATTSQITVSSEAVDENLMSLLDELDFFNQQLNNEPSQPQGGASSLTKDGNIQTNLSEKESDLDRDDERSLSPLFLRLDEDLIASTNSKDEMDDIPPKVDDLVKVIFGSDSPPNSSESELVAGASEDHVLGCNLTSDAPSLPPLLQMKAGGRTTTDSLKEQACMSWRPMPKLAPLGLKTQEAGQAAVKSGSKPPSLRSAHM